MATISPSPFPESGQRKLSAREVMQRAKAAACTVPQDNKPSCSGQVTINVEILIWAFQYLSQNFRLTVGTPKFPA